MSARDGLAMSVKADKTLEAAPFVPVKLASVKAKATDDSMRDHWTGGKFTVIPNVPVKVETPKHIRDFKLLPLSKETPGEVLKRHGTAVINVKGKKSDTDKTVGQDMFSCTYLGNGWWLDLVADGHGTVGDFVADRVCKTVPHFMDSDECSSLLAQNNIDEAFAVAFERAQKDVEDTLGPVVGNKLMFSGSTCICLLRQQGSMKLHVAWVGDSKAILITPDGTVKYRTMDHKPENEVERKRICASGCEVIECQHDDGVVLQKINVAGQSYPAISFTRSFGDQCVKDKGVHARPEVQHWDCAPNKGFASLAKGAQCNQDGFVLLASDGIWEFLTEEEVGKYIGDSLAAGKSAEAMLPDLVKLSQQRWKENEDDYCDDITACFVTVKTPVHQPPVPEAKGCECFAMCSVM